MKSFDFGRDALTSCVALALLAGCGGSQLAVGASGRGAPSGAPDLARLPLQPNGAAASHHQGQSQMSPDAVSRARLLYVSDANANIVYALSLPSGKLVGKLTGFDQPLGLCVDVKGDLFVADSQPGAIRVYKHGARQPFMVLDDSNYYPVGCSIDPTTGDLAVSNAISRSSGSSPGDVAIYQHARGRPKHYKDPDIYYYGFCSFDNHGNLFVGGFTRASNDIQVAELRKDSKTFTNIKLDQALRNGYIPPLLWDGKHLAVASQYSPVIYQFKISGRRGTTVGTTRLKRGSPVGGFWLDNFQSKTTLYAPLYRKGIGSVGVYPYPTGGKPSAIFYAVANPTAVTVSVKSK